MARRSCSGPQRALRDDLPYAASAACATSRSPGRAPRVVVRVLAGADAAHVRLSYSPELIPLSRRLCFVARHAPLGDVLVSVLRGTGVYRGDLLTGDRMLEVPAPRTMGVSAAWAAARWSAMVSLTGAEDWINYDLLNRQVGEPDDVTVLPGRSVLLSVRTSF